MTRSVAEAAPGMKRSRPARTKTGLSHLSCCCTYRFGVRVSKSSQDALHAVDGKSGVMRPSPSAERAHASG